MERAISTAEKIIAGELSIFEGSSILHALGNEITGEYFHPDFCAFSNLVDDLCHIPVGAVRERFSSSGLERMDREQKMVEEREREWILDSCHKLIEKYGKKDT